MKSRRHIMLFLVLMLAAFVVSGCDGVGGGGGTTETPPAGPPTVVGDTSAPSIPANLTATATSDAQINLAWGTSTDNNAVSHYDIFRDGTYIINSTAPSYSDTGLTANTNYCYTVKAIDPNGNTSAASPTVCAKTASVFTASGTYTFKGAGVTNGLSMVWTASTFECCGPMQGETTLFTVSALTSSQMTWVNSEKPTDQMVWTKISKPMNAAATEDTLLATWKMTAPDGSILQGTFSKSGSTYNVALTGTIFYSLEGPANLSAIANGTSVNLSWSAPSNYTPASYFIYKNGKELTMLDSSLTTYTDSNLMPGVQVCYTVTAKDADGIESSKSNESCATPGSTGGGGGGGGGVGGGVGAPTTPTALMAYSPMPDTIAISWGPSTDPDGIMGYDIFRDNMWYASVPGMQTMFTDYNAMDMSGYHCYKVQAKDTKGMMSAQSGEQCTSASGGGTQYDFPPSSPQNLMVTSTTSNSISLSWMSSMDDKGIASYDIFRDGMWMLTVPGVQTTFTDNAPMLGKSNCYTVKAIDTSMQFSPESNSVCASPGSTITPPTMPTMVNAYPGPSMINLSWSPSTSAAGIMGYDIFRDGMWYASVPGMQTMFADYTLGQHCYTVQAKDNMFMYSAMSTPPACTTASAGGTDMPPAAPENLMAASPQPGLISLSWWTAADDFGIQSYDIWRDGMWYANVMGYQTFYDDYAPTPGMTHCYMVQAIDTNWQWSPPSMQSCAMAQQAPPPGGGGSAGGFIGFDDMMVPAGWVFSSTDPNNVNWHFSSNRYASPSYSLRYGNPSNANSFAGSTANSGEIVTSGVALFPNASLSFNYYLDGECPTGSDCYYDKLMVSISTDGGMNWTMIKPTSQPDITMGLKDNAGSATPAMPENVTFDLNAYAGMDAKIKFRFDTIDSAVNEFEGAFIDNVNLNPGTPPMTTFDDGSLQGWQATGLWHVSAKRYGNSAPNSAYYGDEMLGTFDVPTGTANSGDLISPAKTLGNAPVLNFKYFLSNECQSDGMVCYYDALTVWASKDNGQSWIALQPDPNGLPGSMYGLVNYTIDLSCLTQGLSNSNVMIKFNFNTKDGVGNAYEGAYVDDIEVTTSTGGCPGM